MTRRRTLTILGVALASVLVIYFSVAYIVMPWAWERFFLKHPSLNDNPRITLAKDGLPGDPVNVALIGTEEELLASMLAADWYVADALGLRANLKIAAATVLKRPYDDAPVSDLFLFDRKQDVAFEQPVGDDPRQRHHIRFWRAKRTDFDGRPIWIGAGTYDESVGLSRTTGQITHHVAEDVDTERDHVVATLQKAGLLSEDYLVPGFHINRTGRNGGGDPWKTDGDLRVGVLRAGTQLPEESAPK
jgi:hypothetical protein